MATLADSYSETNKDTASSIQSAGATAAGQSFTAIAGNLDSCKFYLAKTGSPTGNMVARLYALTGTFGTDSKPTGAALATSGSIDVSTLTGSFVLVTFSFTGVDRVTLVNGTKYVIVFEYTGGDGSNLASLGGDGSAPSHAGNRSLFIGGSWSVADNNLDYCFYLYEEILGTSPSASASSSSSASQSPSASRSPSASLSPSASTSPSASLSPSSSASSSLSPSASVSMSVSASPSSPTWINQTENDVIWANQSRNNATFTKQAKNDSTWDNQDKTYV